MDKTLQLKIIAALQDKLSAPLQRMRGASGKTAGSMKDLRDKLKGLEARRSTTPWAPYAVSAIAPRQRGNSIMV